MCGKEKDAVFICVFRWIGKMWIEKRCCVVLGYVGKQRQGIGWIDDTVVYWELSDRYGRSGQRCG